MSSSVKMEYTKLAQEDKEQTNSEEIKKTFEAADSSEQASKCACEDVCKKKFKLTWPFIILISAALLISVALLIINLAASYTLALKLNTQTLEIATLKGNYTTLEKLVANEQKIQLDKIMELQEQFKEMNETWTVSAAFETDKTRNEIKEVQQGMRALNESLDEQQTTMAVITSEVTHEIKEIRQSMRTLNNSLEKQQTEITQLAKQLESSNNSLILQLGVTRENITSLSKLIGSDYSEIRANFSAVERDITSLRKALAETGKADQIEQIQARLSTMNSNVQQLSLDLHKLRVETRSNIFELSEHSSRSLQQFQEQLASYASKLNKIVMAVDQVKATTSKADKQIQDYMRGQLFAKITKLQTSQKSLGDFLDRLQGEVNSLHFSVIANQSLKSKVNSQDQKMRSLESSVIAKQTSQRSKDNSQDKKIKELWYEVHGLMSSAYQHNSSTLTTILCCVVVVYTIVTVY